MAERRMFTQKIVDSDPFLDMPLSAQALYFHLNMRADDDGFVNNPKRIQRTVGACEDDLKLLLAKRFLIGFDNGVIVIKHWRMHNTLRKDRYNPTQYQEEFAQLEVKDNNAYTERLETLPEPETETLATTWQPHGNHLEPQYSIGKGSIVEDRLVEDSVGEDATVDSDESEPSKPKGKKRPTKQKYGEFQNVRLTEEEFDKLGDDFGIVIRTSAIAYLDAYIEEKGYKSKSHNLAIRRWVVDAVNERISKSTERNVANEHDPRNLGTAQRYGNYI